MNGREMRKALTGADPVGGWRLDGLDFEAMEADLLADVEGERAPLVGAGPARPPRRRRLVLAFGSAVLAAVIAVFFILDGGSDHPARAYGAEQIRFAESTPLLLLDGPGWRVENVDEDRTREGIEGSMEFITGKPIPDESVRITGTDGRERESGMSAPAVRQRKVELSWRHGSVAEAVEVERSGPHPHGQRWVELPVLETTARVDTRAEFYVNQGGPGNRQMVAFWSEGGYLLELRAAVPDQAAFEERLGWLTKVDSETWLDGMPAKVVKAADHDVVVAEMLKGIPLPATFSPSRIPDEGLTTNRYQTGAKVTSTVACLWFRQWGEARRTGDTAAELEAEQAMATSRHWPILREMAQTGSFPETFWTLAREMPSGVWKWDDHTHPLLPKAEALDCARLGIPLLPRKMKLQHERGLPLPRG